MVVTLGSKAHLVCHAVVQRAQRTYLSCRQRRENQLGGGRNKGVQRGCTDCAAPIRYAQARHRYMQAGDVLALELLTDIGGTINVQPSRLSHCGTPQILQPPKTDIVRHFGCACMILTSAGPDSCRGIEAVPLALTLLQNSLLICCPNAAVHRLEMEQVCSLLMVLST